MSRTPQRSPGGVFIRSPGGVRGGGLQEVILLFIDESSTYTIQPGLYWLPDLNRWEIRAATGGFKEYGIVVGNVPPGDIYPLLNPPYDGLPTDVTIMDVSRPVSYANFKEVYDEARIGKPPLVTILVDISGSMTRDDLEPGIDTFEDWLDNENITWQEIQFSNEQWLWYLHYYTYPEDIPI